MYLGSHTITVPQPPADTHPARCPSCGACPTCGSGARTTVQPQWVSVPNTFTITTDNRTVYA